MTLAGVVLAAGGGTRFAASGGSVPKQLATVADVALVDHALAAAAGAGLAEVLLVDGSLDLRDRASPVVTVLHNERWREGLAASLQVALAHARSQGHEAVVVGLADQPGVTPRAWALVAAAPPEPPIAIATYCGRRGHPVRLAAAVWDLLPATGDQGARAVVRERPELVREVPCPGEPHDVDTTEDLERWS